MTRYLHHRGVLGCVTMYGGSSEAIGLEVSINCCIPDVMIGDDWLVGFLV